MIVLILFFVIYVRLRLRKTVLNENLGFLFVPGLIRLRSILIFGKFPNSCLVFDGYKEIITSRAVFLVYLERFCVELSAFMSVGSPDPI